MKSTKLLFLVAAFALAIAAQETQDTLTNSRVASLVRLGVSAPEIMRIIGSAPQVSFDLRPGSTDNLLKAGVPEEIIKAMAARESGSAILTPRMESVRTLKTKAATPAPAAISSPHVDEVGAYYWSENAWVQMMPEVVNWRVGGVVKTLATGGIVKPDRNAHLRNGRSKTPLRTPIRLLVYTPEGTQITEYQLIRLHIHTHAREFRTVTGAILHVHGDSDRDDLPFDGQHVGIRTWTISLSGLKPGEYGLLPPGLAESQSASAQLGKMYTFTVVE